MANRKKRCEAREAGRFKPKSFTSSKSVQHDGRTYILDPNSSRAFCVDPPVPVLSLMLPATTDFAVLATDNMTPSFFSGLPSGDRLEYESYISLNLPDDLKATVD
jgi:hypothetical protein